MNEQIVDILRWSDNPASLYAADRIEELEAELEAMLCAALGKPGKVAKRGCRHAISNYQLDGDTGHVWCFACKPPRRIT